MTTSASRFALAFALVAALGPLPAAAARDEIFTLTDPRGDDHGAGNLTYPRNDDYAPGDLDIVSFTARAGDDGTWFDVTFARPIRTPDGRTIDGIGTTLKSAAKLGFFTFNVDVYVDMDGRANSGALLAMPGRNLALAPNNAWDRAIVLTPQPHAARAALKAILDKRLREELKDPDASLDPERAAAIRTRLPDDVERHVFFPTLVRVRGPKVSFFVPDDFLGGKADPAWGYVVAVSGADLIQSYDVQGALTGNEKDPSLMILPVAPGARIDRFGGGREGAAGVEAPIVDAIVPADLHQEELLRRYDVKTGEPAALPAVIPGKTP